MIVNIVMYDRCSVTRQNAASVSILQASVEAHSRGRHLWTDVSRCEGARAFRRQAGVQRERTLRAEVRVEPGVQIPFLGCFLTTLLLSYFLLLVLSSYYFPKPLSDRTLISQACSCSCTRSQILYLLTQTQIQIPIR